MDLAPYTITSSFYFISIFINGLLHVQLPKSVKISVNSWIDVAEITIWKIEFINSETGKIIVLCEYDSRDKWESILTLWSQLFK